MLVKLTCRGRDRRSGRRPGPPRPGRVPHPRRATNLAFLHAVLDDPDFRAGRVTTSFIEERPELLTPLISGIAAPRS